MRGVAGIALALVVLATTSRPAHAAEIEDRVSSISRLADARSVLERDERRAQATYQSKTADIARLKAQPASFHRNRMLDALLRESKDMATAMTRHAERLRAADRVLLTERKALVSAIDRELVATTDPARRTSLEALKNETASQIRLASKLRRLALADESIDPLDDPEDLEEKAASLAESEARLRREEVRLGKRVAYFQKQDQLEQHRRRSSEADLFRDEQPRQVTHKSVPPVHNDKQPDNPGLVNPFTADDRETADAEILLSDVVLPGTLSELKRAEQAGDPQSRAMATERARQEIRARAEQLRQRRVEMERRARELRTTP
jgi:hypothetical protein